MLRHTCTTWLVGSLLALGPVTAARADEAPGASPVAAPEATPAAAGAVSRRIIGGHTFLPGGAAVEGPLAVPYFGLVTSFGLGDATGTILDEAGEPTNFTRTYTYGGMTEAVEFQAIFKDRWALRGNVTGTVVSGIDTPSILVVGAVVNAGGSLGVEYSSPWGERSRWGVSFDVDRSPQLNVLVAAAILKAIQDGSIADVSVLGVDQVLTLRPAFSAAWAPSEGLGLTARAAYAHTSTSTESYGDLKRDAITLGVSADMDLKRLWSVLEMGMNLSLVNSIAIRDSVAGITDRSIGFWYTGRPDATAGLVIGQQSLQVRPQYPQPLSGSLQYARIQLRIYWP